MDHGKSLLKDCYPWELTAALYFARYVRNAEANRWSLCMNFFYGITAGKLIPKSYITLLMHSITVRNPALFRCLLVGITKKHYCTDTELRKLQWIYERVDKYPVQDIRSIYQGLLDLKKEFVLVELKEEDLCLAVVTHPVIFGKLNLGNFIFQLSLARLCRDGPNIRCIARTPNPPWYDESITHPHVRFDKLCTGRYEQRVDDLISAGYIYEYFQMLHRILLTYNAKSPYARLDIWNGYRCVECGNIGRHESQCYKCDRHICKDCLIYCEYCGCIYCQECGAKQVQCGECRILLCDRKGCRYICDECDKVYCKSCYATHKEVHHQTQIQDPKITLGVFSGQRLLSSEGITYSSTSTYNTDYGIGRLL
jgi:hypothetical protein